MKPFISYSFFVLTVGILFFPNFALATDLPSYLDTKVAGGSGNDYVNAIKEDSQGNVFITGNFATGAIDFNPGSGTDTFTNAGSSDIFLTKFNADGTYAWTKVWGGTGADNVYKIAFDSDDNIYLAAEFAATVDLDPTSGVDSYTSAGSVDIALIKLNADGSYAYSKVMGSTSHDRLHTVQIASDDSIYIAGKFTGTVDFDPGVGTDSKVSAGNYDAYFTKFNADGTYGWTKTWGGTDRDTVNDMALDSNGNFYLAGVFRGTPDFDTSDGTDTYTTAGLDDAFLTRYNADGTYGWTKTWGSTTNDFSFNIGVSPSNDVYIVGSYQLTVDFDPTVGVSSFTAAGLEDSYVSKFESDGTYDLTYTWGGSLMDELNAITFDADGTWYVGGFFNGSIDFDPTSGTDTIASNGPYDQFFSVFSADDAYLTSVTFGSATEVNWYDEILYDLYATDEKLYLGGFFNGTTDFDPGAGTDSFTSAGGWELYYSTYSLDASGPVLSSVVATPATTTVTITWTTDELASSLIEYGLTSAYGTSTTEADTSPRVTGHSVTVSSLVECTTYHFRAKSTDALSNLTSSTGTTFTTLGCTGSADVLDEEEASITTASGGTLALTSGSTGIALDIPAGATGADAIYQVKSLNQAEAFTTSGTPTGMRTIGSYAFDLKALTGVGTAVTSFLSPIEITLTYQDSDVSGIDESSLTVYRFDGTSWSALSGCSVNARSNTITCSTSNFSVFSLFGEAAQGSSGGGTRYGCKDTNALNYENFASHRPSLCKYASTTVSSTAQVSTFSRSLDVGSSGEDVKRLQMLLNASGFSVAATGPGSPGNETTLFGNATKAALAKFQVSKNISPALGYFGPVTRALVENAAEPVASVPKAEEPAQSVVSTAAFLRDLEFGMTGSDVNQLQEILISKNSGPSAKALSDNGSSAYFGNLTKQAVIEFQTANGISPALGYFGPKTKLVIGK